MYTIVIARTTTQTFIVDRPDLESAILRAWELYGGFAQPKSNEVVSDELVHEAHIQTFSREEQ